MNDPEQLFAVCTQFGSLASRKADDMHAQQRSAGQGDGKVAVIVDSGADIPDPILEALDIHMLPVRVNFGTQDFLDKVSLTPQQFYRKLRSSAEHPKTSQPPAGDFRRQFEFLGAHHEAVVSISVSGHISGTFQAAQTAAGKAVGVDVRVLDSANMAAGQGLLAVSAAEAAQAGFDANTVIRYLDFMSPRTRTYAMIPDMRYGVRGGRIPRIVKSVADVLHLTPILGNRSGRVGLRGVLFGRRAMLGAFARFVRRRMQDQRRWRLLVTHADCPMDGKSLQELLQSGAKNIEASYICETGTALGVHAGPGALVVGVQEIMRPQQWQNDAETNR